MTLNTADFDTRLALVNFVNGAVATGNFKMPDPRDLTDEQSVTLDDGTNPATEFRIDAGGDGVGGGATAVDTSAVADGDKAALASAWQTAINGVGGGLAMTAAASGDRVGLVNDAAGVAGNVALIQGGTRSVDFGLTGMSGGSDAIANANLFRIMKDSNNRWMLFWTS